MEENKNVIIASNSNPLETCIVELINMSEAMAQPEKLSNFKNDPNFRKIVENVCRQRARSFLLGNLLMEQY